MNREHLKTSLQGLSPEAIQPPLLWRGAGGEVLDCFASLAMTEK